MGRKLLEGLIIGLVVGAGIVVLWSQGTLDVLENKSWDLRAQNFSKPGPDTDKIRLIFIDQESLDWAADPEHGALNWPWPREVYYPLLKFCRRGGAKAVIFDIVFTEPSSYGVEDDTRFAKGIERTRAFVGAMFVGTRAGVATWPNDLPRPGIQLSASEHWENRLAAGRLPSSNASFPVPDVAKNVSLLGDVYGKADEDAVFRRTHLVRLFDEETVPSLGLAAFLAPMKAREISITEDGNLVVAERTVPLDQEGRAVLRYRGPSQTHKAYSAAAIIQSELRLQEDQEPTVNPDDLKDCYVFLGLTAHGLYDLKPSPVDSAYPGVEIHATVLDNLLSNDFVEEIPYELTLGYALFAALLCSIAVRSSNRAWKTILVFLFLVPVPVLLSVAAYGRGIWLPAVLPEVGVVGAFMCTIVVKYIIEGRKKRFIKNAFKQYLSHDVINALLKHPERLKLGGEKKVLSIYFSDLEGFTSISEHMGPEDLTEWLNQYLTAMSDIIKDEQGTIDKFEGDAIIAFWNAPLSQPDHAARAVRAALRCQQKLTDMRLELRKKAGRDVAMRIGVHTGPVVVGNLGTRSRFDYTIVGDAANLASRLEGLNKHFGTRTLISESTLEHVKKDVAARELSTVAVKGKSKPVKIFEPMSKLEFSKRRYLLRTFAQGLEKFYEGDFQEAQRLFGHTRDRDKAALWYTELCQQLMDDPPENWNGVWTMEKK